MKCTVMDDESGLVKKSDDNAQGRRILTPEGFYIGLRDGHLTVGTHPDGYGALMYSPLTLIEIPDDLIVAARAIWKKQKTLDEHRDDVRTLLMNPQFERA